MYCYCQRIFQPPFDFEFDESLFTCIAEKKKIYSKHVLWSKKKPLLLNRFTDLQVVTFYPDPDDPDPASNISNPDLGDPKKAGFGSAPLLLGF